MPTDSASRTATIAFARRSAEGGVTITYSANNDPARWGFDLLGLSFGAEVARGFPVVQAKTSFPREGYAALLGCPGCRLRSCARRHPRREGVGRAGRAAPGPGGEQRTRSPGRVDDGVAQQLTGLSGA